VSHDRHFLNKVCTHTADIDFQKVQLYTGNYDFWRAASEMVLRHRQAKKMKNEDRAKELKTFIARFSANASKSRQATARKKMLEKLDVEAIAPSSRKYPHIVFDPEKVHGKQVLRLEDVSKSMAGECLFADVTLTVTRGERIVVLSRNSVAASTLLEVIAGAQQPDAGRVTWGPTVRTSFLHNDYADLFEDDLNVIDWLRLFSEDQDEGFIRQFLGRMLFTGDDTKKSVRVLSGGERVRCMVARLMLEDAPCMVLDGPTNHLDLESIISLNNALVKRTGTLIFGSHDVELIESLADRVLEIRDGNVIDHQLSYAEYLRRHTEELGLAVGV
jgi:ATPase subunit of ABC transporter with duplicated ATPase domains